MGLQTIGALFAVVAIIAVVELGKAGIDQMPCDGFWGGFRIGLGMECR